MKRTYLKLKEGDIFKIIHETEVRYFQYFYTDMNYLGGDLVWVFNYQKATDNIDMIMSSGYKFYLYTTIQPGVKMKLFEKIGNASIPKEMHYIPKFRYTGDDLTKEIEKWTIIQGDKKEIIGKDLTEEQKKLPFAAINFPWDTIKNMILGYDSFMKIN